MARLQAANPKGKLLEWCAQSKTPPPDFERDASAEGYRIRAVLAVGGREPIATTWYVSAKLKVAEHAAAEEVLQRLPQEPAAEAPQAALPPQTTSAVAYEAPKQRNPVGALNELRQAGVLESAGFELLEQAGPSHQRKQAVWLEPARYCRVRSLGWTRRGRLRGPPRPG